MAKQQLDSTASFTPEALIQENRPESLSGVPLDEDERFIGFLDVIGDDDIESFIAYINEGINVDALSAFEEKGNRLYALYHILSKPDTDAYKKDMFSALLPHTKAINAYNIAMFSSENSTSDLDEDSPSCHIEYPIHIAATDSDPFYLKGLLKKRAILTNIKDSNNATPLHLAAQFGCLRNVQLLIKQLHKEMGPSEQRDYILSEDKDGVSAIAYAAFVNLPIFSMLLYEVGGLTQDEYRHLCYNLTTLKESEPFSHSVITEQEAKGLLYQHQKCCKKHAQEAAARAREMAESAPTKRQSPYDDIPALRFYGRPSVNTKAFEKFSAAKRRREELKASSSWHEYVMQESADPSQGYSPSL